MKISINIDPELTETEIIINAASLTAETENIIAVLRMADNKIFSILKFLSQVFMIYGITIGLLNVFVFYSVHRRTVYLRSSLWAMRVSALQQAFNFCSRYP